MRAATAILVSLLVAAAGAVASSTTIGQNALNTLTPIDQVPTKEQIDEAFLHDGAQPPLQSLVSIATDTEADIGIRLRAIHALAKYCTTTPCASADSAHSSVAEVVGVTASANQGSSVLLLRAAIETLGTMKVSTDVTVLEPLLEHPSRDIRAATARALRDLCNTHAITPLRSRYSVELTDQVKLSISEALRILGQCSANP
ncbi:MAG TPA: HEAT repeat domain-containing protein [Kofleriaceae bacterium]